MNFHDFLHHFDYQKLHSEMYFATCWLAGNTYLNQILISSTGLITLGLAIAQW